MRHRREFLWREDQRRLARLDHPAILIWTLEQLVGACRGDIRCVKPQIGHQQIAPVMDPADEHRREQCASALDIYQRLARGPRRGVPLRSGRQCRLPQDRRARLDQPRHMDCRLDIAKRVMGVMLLEPVGRCHMLQLLRCLALVVQRKDQRVRIQDFRCLREWQDINTAVAIQLRDIGRVEVLVEQAAKAFLVEPETVVATGDRRRPCHEAAAHLAGKFVIRVGRLIEAGGIEPVDQKRAGARQNLRQAFRANVEAVDRVQIRVGQNSCELKNLAEERVTIGCLGVVEEEILLHAQSINLLNRRIKPAQERDYGCFRIRRGAAAQSRLPSPSPGARPVNPRTTCHRALTDSCRSV